MDIHLEAPVLKRLTRLPPSMKERTVARDYRRSPKETEALQQEIEDMLSKRVIRQSKRPWCFPMVLGIKPDGSIRFCVDYTKLKAATVKVKYPLPRIDDLMDRLQG